ncbi:MAG: cyclic nucleotide binding protein [Devosia sp.]|uniref:Crp/Fnr family transcriptional regulator n=1 Tax=Devosia sp. TaxID=1871048 RepID=UPI002611B617|nr:cyclic nucleotide-binding domain-containing protein [Devosia sp.]MDB5539744.1 cyclic nucleotide binding protein [Devosia sp.]
MESLLSLAASRPIRTLLPREVLIKQGEAGGELFVLESGQLTVERDGVTIATIAKPNSLVGEMSVVLGTANSATVRADRESKVRVIHDARKYLEQNPDLTFRIAWLMASRLDVTSALLVELTKQHGGRNEQGLLGRILSALHLPIDETGYVTVNRNDLFGGRDELSED